MSSSAESKPVFRLRGGTGRPVSRVSPSRIVNRVGDAPARPGVRTVRAERSGARTDAKPAHSESRHIGRLDRLKFWSRDSPALWTADGSSRGQSFTTVLTRLT